MPQTYRKSQISPLPKLSNCLPPTSTLKRYLQRYFYNNIVQNVIYINLNFIYVARKIDYIQNTGYCQ